MKKSLSILLGLLIFFIPLKLVSAVSLPGEGTLSIDCTVQNTMPGGTVNCEIIGTTNEIAANKIIFALKTDNSSVLVQNVKSASDFELTSSTDTGYTFATKDVDGILGTFKIATFDLKVLDSIELDNSINVNVNTLSEQFSFDNGTTDTDIDAAVKSISINPIVSTIKIECDDEQIYFNGTTKCTIKGTTNYTVSKIKKALFKLETDNALALIKDVEPAYGFSLENTSEDGYLFKSTSRNTTNFEIATFTLQANPTASQSFTTKVSASSVVFTFENSVNDTKVTPFNTQVKVINLSGDNYLWKIKLDRYDIGFKSSITEYELTVENKIKKLGYCENYEDENALCINDIEYHEKADITEFHLDDVDLLKWIEKVYTMDDGEEKCNEDDTICEYILNDDRLLYIEDNDEEGIFKSWLKLGDLKVGLNTLKIEITAENKEKREYIFKINRLDENGNDVTNKDEKIEENPKTGAFISIAALTGIATLSSYAIVRLKKKNKFNN